MIDDSGKLVGQNKVINMPTQQSLDGKLEKILVDIQNSRTTCIEQGINCTCNDDRKKALTALKSYLVEEIDKLQPHEFPQIDNTKYLLKDDVVKLLESK